MRKTAIICWGVILILIMAAGCASPGKRTGIGAGAGAAAGAAIGGAAAGWKGAGLGALAGAATGAAIGNYLDKQYKELEQVADTKRVKDGILVNLKNDLLFKTDSATLKPEAISQLNELGDVLAKYKEDRIRIAGYTDSMGPTEYNDTLSERRADAVKAVLKNRGVRDEQMLTQGFGESHPVASNTTVAGRQKNRRVELLIDIPKEQAAAVERHESREPASR